MAEMTPCDFFYAFVLQDHQDWEDDPCSIRKAFHSAVSAFHLADHYFRFYKRRDKEFSKRFESLGRFQTALTSRASCYKVIQDMANAYKHLYTFTNCSIPSGGAIEYLMFGKQTIEEEWQQDTGKPIGRIVIHRKELPTVEFAGAINEVIEMWTNIINSSDQPVL